MADDLYDKLLRDLVRGRDREENYKTVKDSIWQEIKADPDRYLKMFFNNWFNNNWARQPIEFKKRAPYQPKKPLSPEQLKEQRKHDANLRGIALMNVFLSDGETRLKDATGQQIRNEIGWMQLIAKHVKPNEIVGKKLTAQQLFNLKEQSTPKQKFERIA